jgi:hypothetical protein
VKHLKLFNAAREILANALRTTSPITADVLVEPGIELTWEERQAVNGVTILLLDIYGDDKNE